MPTIPPRRILLQRSLPDALTDAVAELDEAGAGWVNVGPAVDEEDLPPPTSGLGRFFGGTGPAVPHATWVAGGARRDGTRRPSQLGIEHGSGPKAVARLREAAVHVPPGWTVRQDHVRRGLVLSVPAGTPANVLVLFLLDASATLATVPVGDRWLADVYTG
ncbi:MAG: hypothetical protein GEV08_07900 [Acidimicrobiia bacterium]|nr:hypothetical protein [Acidimicrobiia bacterium]